MRATLATLAAILLTITLAATLTGCYVGLPCSRHGGVAWTNGKDYQCTDGTWE